MSTKIATLTIDGTFPQSLKMLLRLLTYTVLTFCLLLAVLTLLACSEKKVLKPSPNVNGVSKSNMTVGAVADSAEKTLSVSGTIDPVPCGNGLPRNKQGNCPNIPRCARQCTWNLSAPPKKQCWTYLGQNSVSGYSNQLVNGAPCAWTVDGIP